MKLAAIFRLRGLAATIPEPAAPPATLRPERCLFILGPARSGTTVLQNALNDSPAIFLLGEPKMLEDGEAPGFAARYNAMHRAWGNQQMKSSFCPSLLAQDGSWRDYMTALQAHHRWVGAKLVTSRLHETIGLPATFDAFSCDFYPARFIFTFRDPLATVLSTRDLQMLNGGQANETLVLLRFVAESFVLYIRMLRTFPNVRAVFHDRVDRETFDGLEAWLDTPLPGAHLYYDATRVRTYPPADIDPDAAPILEQLQELYAALRDGQDQGPPTLQMEQNDNHLREDHFTALGAADRRARLIATRLDTRIAELRSGQA